jgi:type II secretory pathway component GspD/PulD (secretin)
MSALRIVRLTGALLVGLGLGSPAAPGREGEEPPTTPTVSAPAEPVVRQVYAVRGGLPKDLASALGLHFHTEQSFRAIPDAGSNTLLLSGSKAALNDALAVLREIDRPARNVHVEILILELATRTGGETGGEARPLDLATLSGPVREVRARVRDFQQKGVVTSVKALELTALTGDSAQSQVGESKPYVTGVTVRGIGGAGGAGPAPVSRSIAYRSLGTSVQVKPTVAADGRVTLDLHVDDSTMRSADSATVGQDEKGSAIPATEFGTVHLETRLTLRPGQFVLAEGSRTGSKAWQAQLVVLVSASTEEANPDGGK